MSINSIGGFNAAAHLLEFEQIRRHLADLTHTDSGRYMAMNVTPSVNFLDVISNQQETSEACQLINLGAGLEFGPPEDIRNLINRANLGGVLSGSELILVRGMVDASISNRFLLKRHEELPILSGMAETLPDLGIVTRSIERAIGESGEVLDQASPTLGSLRRESQLAFNNLNNVIDRNLRRLERQGVLQEPIVTERNGRMVLLVKAEMKYRVPGIVHDVSDSGATVFVEPMSAIDLGNRWREARSAETREEQIILRDLSDLIGYMSDECGQMLNVMAKLDMAFAKGMYAINTKSVVPEVINSLDEDRKLRIMGARHPLLSGDVVPINIEIGEQNNIMLITGPNAGGKTVALKTAGLLVLMAHSGMYVPAREVSMPFFDGIYVDIGDQQSIEQSLSTFSSHIHNLNKILSAITSKSLVLIDELGTSTDPEEGAALAEAVLNHFCCQRVMTIATTHHRRVAQYVQEQNGMMNASVDLDPVTFEPTYHVTSGLPGRSYAMTIAARLGLLPAIINDAQSRMSQEDRESEELLRDLRASRTTVENMKQEAEETLLSAKHKEEQLSSQLNEVETIKIQIVEQARLELQSRIAEIQQSLDRAERLSKDKGHSGLSGNFNVESQKHIVQDIQQEISNPDWQPIELERDRWQDHLNVGDRVFIMGVPRPVEILTLVDEENNVEVLMGTMRAKVPVYQLDRRADEYPNAGDYRRSDTRGDSYRQISGVGVFSRSGRTQPAGEINLHGQRVEDALTNVEQFLNDASLGNLEEIRIVHGKGTGILRQAVREYLDGHPLVINWASDEGPAGNGVTIAWLS